MLESRRLPEALVAHRRAVLINRELARESPSDPRRRVVLAENLNNVGLLTAESEPDRAEEVYREAAELLKTARNDKSNRRALASLGSVLNNWANLAVRRGQTDLALERLRARAGADRGDAPA